MSESVRDRNKDHKLFLLLFTIMIPLTAALCLLLAILVFALVPEIWWFGLIVLLFGAADLAMYFPIRKYILAQVVEETPEEEPADGAPAEDSAEPAAPSEEPSENN